MTRTVLASIFNAFRSKGLAKIYAMTRNADENVHTSRGETHLEELGVGDDDRDNVGDGDDGDDDCDSDWQEAEVTLLPREGTEVLHLLQQTLHHTEATYDIFFSIYKIYRFAPLLKTWIFGERIDATARDDIKRVATYNWARIVPSACDQASDQSIKLRSEFYKSGRISKSDWKHSCCYYYYYIDANIYKSVQRVMFISNKTFKSLAIYLF